MYFRQFGLCSVGHGGRITSGMSLSAYVVKNLALEMKDDSHPREAILKHAKVCSSSLLCFLFSKVSSVCFLFVLSCVSLGQFRIKIQGKRSNRNSYTKPFRASQTIISYTQITSQKVRRADFYSRVLQSFATSN